MKIVLGIDEWSDSIKTVILENVFAPCPHLKQVKEMAEELKAHNRDTLSYDNYQ